MPPLATCGPLSGSFGSGSHRFPGIILAFGHLGKVCMCLRVKKEGGGRFAFHKENNKGVSTSSSFSSSSSSWSVLVFRHARSCSFHVLGSPVFFTPNRVCFVLHSPAHFPCALSCSFSMPSLACLGSSLLSGLCAPDCAQARGRPDVLAPNGSCGPQNVPELRPRVRPLGEANALASFARMRLHPESSHPETQGPWAHE